MESGVPVINQIAPASNIRPPDDPFQVSALRQTRPRDRNCGFHRIIDDLRDTPRWHGRFAQVVTHIHKHYGQNLEMKKLAQLAGVSQSQFERRFNRIFGTTPYEYLLRVRITAARALLETTERTIADIACETGFYDHSHFTRTFKRVVGLSPGRYRKQHLDAGL